jgi:predicted RNA-binding protein with TRAM domain
VPLASIRVDNDDTKSDHFRQWATNKKSDPAECKLEADFRGVKVGRLTAEQPASFSAEIPFTICGRGRAGGGSERVRGNAVLFPAGAYGARTTIRIRATIADFDRDAYRIGPKYTEGWLARVQSLAKVVAEKGTVELSLFASAK